MSDDKPLVSIYVPCLNVEKYIEKCIRSIMGQTYDNIDIVIIDNNSTDGTVEIIEKLKQSDSRIRFFSEERKGISIVRNAAIGYCLGEWIMEVDSDDAITPNAVETLLNLALKNECSFACGSYYLCNTEKNFSEKKPVKLSGFLSKNKEDIHRYFLSKGRNFNQTWGKIYRRDILEKVVYPEGRLYEDLAVMPDVIEACDGCVVTEEPIYYYSIRPGSISSGTAVAGQMDGLELRLENSEFYGEKYPNLSALSYDCVLEFAFFMLGKIKRTGRNDCIDSLDRTLQVIKEISPKAEKQGIAMKAGVLLVSISPMLAAGLFALYSDLKN